MNISLQGLRCGYFDNSIDFGLLANQNLNYFHIFNGAFKL